MGAPEGILAAGATGVAFRQLSVFGLRTTVAFGTSGPPGGGGSGTPAPSQPGIGQAIYP